MYYCAVARRRQSPAVCEQIVTSLPDRWNTMCQIGRSKVCTGERRAILYHVVNLSSLPSFVFISIIFKSNYFREITSNRFAINTVGYRLEGLTDWLRIHPLSPPAGRKRWIMQGLTDWLRIHPLSPPAGRKRWIMQGLTDWLRIHPLSPPAGRKRWISKVCFRHLFAIGSTSFTQVIVIR
jgi:hypothetical protein